MSTTMALGTKLYRDVNQDIHRRIARGEHSFELTDVFGQRYLGCALEEGISLRIHGTPGNDMGAYMDGANIEVFGNGQDQIGNTMNRGTIVIHGHCGDAAGYAMRGGDIFIRDYVGWRTGIHMKQYKAQRPVVVIGGDAGSFLGEYMAGGIVLLLGTPGRYLGTGMHGGVIYLRKSAVPEELSAGIVEAPCTEEDLDTVEAYLNRYNDYFDASISARDGSFTSLRPASSRPYGNMYVKD